MVNRVPTKIIVPAVLVLISTALSGCMAEELWESSGPERSAHQHKEYGYNEQRHHHDDPDHEQGDTERRDPADAYPNGSPRYHNTLEGEEDSIRNVNVPLGTETLRVALIHDSCGDAVFSLWDPTGLDLPHTLTMDPVAEERVDGKKYMDEPDWVVIQDPVPGDWTLNLEIDGQSSYTVSFYLED